MQDSVAETAYIRSRQIASLKKQLDKLEKLEVKVRESSFK